MITINLIRHGKTAGNLEKRYIGMTDEPLCREGIEDLQRFKDQRGYPSADVVLVSPMKRCIQTAEILYPQAPVQVIREFRECDFGSFENKNYRELSSVPEYQEWIDSGGTLPFPGGESRECFQKRCLKGFERVLDTLKEISERTNQKKDFTIACIVHGGTIMSIMEQYAIPSGSYYDFQVGNAKGFVLEVPLPGMMREEKKDERNWRKLWE